MDLVEFVMAHLDEEEAIAKAADHPGAWRQERDGKGVLQRVVGESKPDDEFDRGVVLDTEGGNIQPSDRDADVITLYHPERVLDEVFAKRWILANHGPRVTDELCKCGQPLPCMTLRFMAYPYRDEEGWNPDWHPDVRMGAS